MVFVVFAAFAFVMPFLPLFVRELGIEGDSDIALWAGILIGVSPLLAGLMAPIWGRLADSTGQKPVALKALGVYAVILVLSALVGNVWELLALRVGIGLFGGIGPLGLAMATAGAPREETGRIVGRIQAAQMLSTAGSPFVGGLLADTLGIRATFLVTAAFCLAAFALVAIAYREPVREGARDGVVKRIRFRDVVGRRGIPTLLAVFFLVSFVGRSFTPILPLHLALLGVDPGRLGMATGILVTAYSAAAALSATLSGSATRRFEPKRLLAWSLLAGAATVLPIAKAPSFALVLCLAVALGLVSGGALTLCYTLGGHAVPQELRTTAFGVFASATLFGGAVAPTVAGLLSRLDLRAIYVADAAIFAGLGVFLLVGRRRELVT